MPDRSDYWFPAKRYGWGWGPPTRWQGWVVVLVFVMAVAIIAIRFPPGSEPIAFAALALVAVLTLVAVCWLKGEPARWRWGDKDP